MNSWLQQLRADLDRRGAQSMLRRLRATDACRRRVRRGGRSLVNLAGNDYLALAGHPKLADAVAAAARDSGVGSGASRLLSGDLDRHHQLEDRFAAFKHAEAGLLFPTGYQANLGVLQALAARGDLVCLDKLNHASLIDAARSSGATVRTFPHGNLVKLQRLLAGGAEARRRFIVTDAVFSMDGDCADLPALCDLRDRFDAVLVVDEAHATGVLGASGAGLAEAQGVAGSVDVTVSTAGKALGSLGGLVTGGQEVIDTLVNTARTFIYTTAAPPTQIAAIDAALDVVAAEPQRRERLAELSRVLRLGLAALGWSMTADPTPIVPLVVGEAKAALELAARLEGAGFLAPAIRPPTVARGAARVRLSLRCDLEDDDLTRFLAAVGRGPG